MNWPPQTMVTELLAVVIFGLVGIGLMIVGYKLFDWMTPIKIDEQLGDRQNVAVAIVMAAVIIGVSIVIAAAMS